MGARSSTLSSRGSAELLWKGQTSEYSKARPIIAWAIRMVNTAASQGSPLVLTVVTGWVFWASGQDWAVPEWIAECSIKSWENDVRNRQQLVWNIDSKNNIYVKNSESNPTGLTGPTRDKLDQFIFVWVINHIAVITVVIWKYSNLIKNAAKTHINKFGLSWTATHTEQSFPVWCEELNTKTGLSTVTWL